MVDTVHHDEILVAVQCEVPCHEVGGVPVVAQGIDVLGVGGQPLRHGDVAGEFLIVVFVRILGNDGLAHFVQMLLHPGQAGRLVNAGAAGNQRLIFIGRVRNFFLGSHPVNRGSLFQICNVGIIVLLAFRLGDSAQEGKGVLPLFQTHAVGFRRDGHHVDYILRKAAGLELRQHGVRHRLVGTDDNHRPAAIGAAVGGLHIPGVDG